jgi:ElaB/YqjD/DUF883 family membrane-anchored ribosome-binding protein
MQCRHSNDGEIIHIDIGNAVEVVMSVDRAKELSEELGWLLNLLEEPASEQGELAATDSQQLQAKIRLALEQIKGAALNNDMSTVFRILNQTYAELSAM